MAREEYSVVVEMDDDTPVIREELEFQNFSSGSGVGGKITQDKQPSSNNSGFNDTSFFETRTPQNAPQGGHPLWSIEYYAQYFDVDTEHVLTRAAKSLLPKDNFVDVVGSNPDLYGPFWISTTLIFLLFVTSSIAGSIEAIINDRKKPNYDFTILYFGVIAIYTYTFGVSLFVWGALKYFGCRPSLLDTVGLYGYGLTIWVPISIICVVPHDLLRWVLVLAGFAISAFFITKNLYPVISRAEAKTSRLFLIFVLAAHAAFALLLKFEFFSYETKSKTST
ncbi:Yip1-domain-containing protein [Gigaspora margarita]|uniref:Protein YIP n=1 Tax=Gigaspora margarita TaxID=4874 RepID=A0A8H3WWP6_GIGMA|nr:Yip1-domain-containing protein [Gigaspora margarita]